ncbi:MAG: hypothetical protein NTX61_18115 [Bacteroidetes bacterium]|nr:hypothetical protein [Bacteroidota bacterium]
MEEYFSSKRIINILVRWKYHLAIIAVVAILLSAFFSGPIFITPLFKSFAIMYPSNVSPYATENETEQMIQIFQSKDIRDTVIKKFNLAQHYGIDLYYKYFLSTMLWEWGNRVKINKTPYEAVVLEVYDQDPIVASDMANTMIDCYNMKVRNLHKEKFQEVVENFRQVTELKRKDLDSLKARAEELGTKYGVLDFPNQTKEVMKAYLGSSSMYNKKEAERLKKSLEENGGEMMLLGELMKSEAGTYSQYKLDFDRAIQNYQRQYTYVNLLNKPFPADKKSYPVRWIIILVSTIAAMFIAIMVIGFIEDRKFKKQQI